MASSSELADLAAWATARLAPRSSMAPLQLVSLAGDASSRRYFRTEVSGQPYVVAHAPPATEKNEAFLEVRRQLAVAGIRVPEVIAADLDQGYLLLEDLGDSLLLPELSAQNVDGYYHRASEILLKLASAPVNLPPYDETLLTEELTRFPHWFLGELLGHDMAPGEVGLIDDLWSLLVANAIEQPKVLVHRDFHSRNLMLVANDELAVIDFQDAVLGPVTYDLVSLLRDCYVCWPQQRVRSWALSHRDALQAAGSIAPVSDEHFCRWFDLMGLQRHLKVLGTFARLYLRDGKAGYLSDLPLVLRYVRQVLATYSPFEPAFSSFSQWWDEVVQPKVARQNWSRPG